MLIKQCKLTRYKRFYGSQPSQPSQPSQLPLAEKYPSLNFTQLLDHFDDNNATFNQRYWVNTAFYRPGGPVFFVNGGEESASNVAQLFLSKLETSMLAKKFGGVVVVMEHRYYGESKPFPVCQNFTMI